MPPCGNVWFGTPYDRDAEQAAGHGRPIAHLPDGHLHMLLEPDPVAAAVLQMADAWR